MKKPHDIHKTKAYKQRRRTRVWRKVKRHGWWIGLLVLLILVVAVQVFYPPQYTLPLAQYNHEPYGMKHQSELAQREQQRFVSTKVQLRGSTGEHTTSLSKMGATLDESTSLDTLTHYPLKWRFVPFSIVFWQPDVTTLPVEFATGPLDEFSESFAKKHTVYAKNAQLKLQKDKVEAIDARPGRIIDVSELAQTIKKKRYDASGVARVNVPERTVLPTATAQDLAPVRQEAQAIIAKQILVTVPGRDQTFTPTRAQITSWLQLSENKGKVKLELNQKALEKYGTSIDKQVAQPARPTLVEVVDGREQTQQAGQPGEQINKKDFAQKISSTLFVPGEYKFIQTELEPITPEVKRTYSYTNSQAGLRAKVAEIGRRYDVRISLQQLDGAGWQADYRASESTPSASTYKLYVALRLFHEMSQGRTAWDSPILGTTVADCFDQMIIVSTNQCAEEWLRQFNRSEVNNFLYQRGISRVTTFTSPDATRTSAGDLVRVVKGIYDGSLVTGGNRDKLLEMMSRQIWRKGIPIGTKGWTSDKVGFLWDYIHDVGVVHHPRGTYVMAVMTKGASYGIIAQITRELEAIMYP